MRRHAKSYEGDGRPHFVHTDATEARKAWQTVTLTNARVTDLQRATLELDDAAKTSMLADTITFTYQKMQLTDVASGQTAVVSSL